MSILCQINNLNMENQLNKSKHKNEIEKGNGIKERVLESEMKDEDTIYPERKVQSSCDDAEDVFGVGRTKSAKPRTKPFDSQTATQNNDKHQLLEEEDKTTNSACPSTSQDDVEYLCVECDAELDDMYSSREKRFKCYKCDYCAKQISHLKDHLRLHTGEKPYKCTICDYTSAQKSSMNDHMRFHTGEKPYKCTECDYAAIRKGTLKIHMRVHTGEKPFRCAECDYSAIQKSNLKIHMRVHSGAKPYECPECDYAAKQKSDLTIHMRLHTGERPFKCTECEYAARQKRHLKKHMKVHLRRIQSDLLC